MANDTGQESGAGVGLLAKLQTLVNGFAMDVGRARAGLADPKTPEIVRPVLCGALNYALDSWDIFPDHFRGVGVADDAIILRLAAEEAVTAGASHRGLQQLAADMKLADALLGDLVAPLRKLLAALPTRDVKGRTAVQILADANVRTLWEADLNRMLKKHETTVIETTVGGPDALVHELQKMVRASLKKSGLL